MTTDTYDTMYVGVNVFVMREGKLLFGKRKNIFGDGTWALPGGHLEKGENIADAAARELKEETNLIAPTTELEFRTLVNTPNGSRGHYIQLGFLAKEVIGEPENLEPDRCYELGWFEPSKLPAAIFPTHDEMIKNFFGGKYFADAPLKSYIVTT
ncbi:MAG: NUDIX domain-containing protein [Candidatus Andersenbacteria bacterium]|nr:NUDIX domain-containing protein [Candidatus Andersenbacteria bacterium]MBI3250482.1 NUDIX domain-containing protein [Candidatus Andersenbacteria bacterium]